MRQPPSNCQGGGAGSNPVVRSRETAGQGRCDPVFLLLRTAESAKGPVGSRLVRDFGLPAAPDRIRAVRPFLLDSPVLTMDDQPSLLRLRRVAGVLDHLSLRV
jgi:hypothetical protein